LSLTDSQFVRLIALKRTLDSTNVPLLRKIDSVQRLFKNGVPIFSSPSAARLDSRGALVRQRNARRRAKQHRRRARNGLRESVGDADDNGPRNPRQGGAGRGGGKRA